MRGDELGQAREVEVGAVEGDEIGETEQVEGHLFQKLAGITRIATCNLADPNLAGAVDARQAVEEADSEE